MAVPRYSYMAKSTTSATKTAENTIPVSENAQMNQSDVQTAEPTLKKVVEKTQKALDSIEVITDGNVKVNVKVVDPKLRNTRGETVDVKDYFYAPEGQIAIAPPYFSKSCGTVCEREDLVQAFESIFKPEDNFILLKDQYKEVYGVLVPLSYTKIGPKENSIIGDYMYHAVSFVSEGSANMEMFISFLKKVARMYKYAFK